MIRSDNVIFGVQWCCFADEFYRTVSCNIFGNRYCTDHAVLVMRVWPKNRPGENLATTVAHRHCC